VINSELLRYNHQHLDKFSLPTNKEIVLDNIEEKATEILVEADVKNFSSFEIKVFRSPGR
jgi:hypothetical protein